MRTVHIQFTTDELTSLTRNISNDPSDTFAAIRQVDAAVGYLCTWASDSAMYGTCTLHIRNGDAEIIATYRDADNKITYQIGAVWNGTAFGFHS